MSRKKRPFNNYPFEFQQPLEVEIESISNLGDGVAKVPVTSEDGEDSLWVIFVPFTLLGEKVRIQIQRNDKNCSHALVEQVLEPSPDRVEARCIHFGQCGGCQYQHVSYARQLHWKQQQVGELLNHLAGVNASVNAPLPSPQEWNYRSKITPHLQKAKNGKVKEIGFLKKGSSRDLLDIKQCPIAHTHINQALPRLLDGVRLRAKSYSNGETLLIRTNEERVYDNPREIMSEQVGDLTFHFLAGDFFQNNPYILNDFVDYARKQAAVGTRYLIDAYCGSGLFGLSLARDFEAVSMVEVSATGADWARYNAEFNKIDNAQILTASAEKIFDDISYPAAETTVLIDPPRKGCNPEFLQQLFDFAPTRVVYISCDPSTQARDLKAFHEAQYKIIDVQPVDLFPQTRHLECIVTLVAD